MVCQRRFRLEARAIQNSTRLQFLSFLERQVRALYGIIQINSDCHFINLESWEKTANNAGMKATVEPGPTISVSATRPEPILPLWLKLAYTAFMGLLVPIYWRNYGPTNFLYF